MSEESSSPLYHMKAARMSLGRALYWAEKEYYSTEVIRLLIQDVDKVLKKMDDDYYEKEGKA